MSARCLPGWLLALALLAACGSEPAPSRTPTESTSPDSTVEDEILLAALEASEKTGLQTVPNAIMRVDIELRDSRSVCYPAGTLCP